MRGVRDALIALLLLPLLGDACRGAVAAAPDASARARLGEARTDAVAHAATGALAAAHAAPRGLPHPSSLPPIPGARHLRPPPGRTSGGGAGGAAGAPRVAVPVDPLGNVERLADCLYNQNNLSCIPEYCRPGVVVHGDGVFLPRTSFVGVTWAQDIHREWFQAFSSWRYEPLEVAATPAVKGFTDVYVLFRWTATNTGSYHGQTPSGRPSLDYGVMRVTADKGGLVTDVALRRGGFQEERDALLIDATRTDEISVRPSITDQPFWIPSQSLQLRMVTRAHALLEVLNQGEKFLDALDDLAVPGVELLDGGDMWGPAAAQGLPALKMWLAAWLQGYGGVTAAVTGSAVTQLSNKARTPPGWVGALGWRRRPWLGALGHPLGGRVGPAACAPHQLRAKPHRSPLSARRGRRCFCPSACCWPPCRRTCAHGSSRHMRRPRGGASARGASACSACPRRSKAPPRRRLPLLRRRRRWAAAAAAAAR
ncbi:MAG: hypothetical protein J3K34DRAFT_439716 [Monoraphidium minutum]|nr:MAG: hypothetical protein J3K34DRAFT_439716 [Monoraphidium minutum]